MGIIARDAEPRNNGQVRIFSRGFCRVIDEKLAVLFESRMEGEAEEAFLVLLVVVLHAIADVEKRLHLVGVGLVGPDMDGAVLRDGKDAIRAVAGAHEEQRTRVAELARIGPQ